MRNGFTTAIDTILDSGAGAMPIFTPGGTPCRGTCALGWNREAHGFTRSAKAPGSRASGSDSTEP
jgi:hypothetical protein